MDFYFVFVCCLTFFFFLMKRYVATYLSVYHTLGRKNTKESRKDLFALRRRKIPAIAVVLSWLYLHKYQKISFFAPKVFLVYDDDPAHRQREEPSVGALRYSTPLPSCAVGMEKIQRDKYRNGLAATLKLFMGNASVSLSLFAPIFSRGYVCRIQQFLVIVIKGCIVSQLKSADTWSEYKSQEITLEVFSVLPIYLSIYSPSPAQRFTLPRGFPLPNQLYFFSFLFTKIKKLQLSSGSPPISPSKNPTLPSNAPEFFSTFLCYL